MRGIAANIAKLPDLLRKGSGGKPMTLRWCVVIALACLPLLAACDNNQQAKKSNSASELIEKETALMADSDRAGPELEKRLADRVKVDGGVLLVRTGMDQFVLPVSTPWTLRCSGGMSIVFGNWVSNEVSRGDSNEDFEVRTTNDVEVLLTIGNIDDKNCEVLAPRIGKRLLAILGGPDQRARQ
jgi:hypothetical protein